MSNLLASYGWWIVALVLIAAEMILPGYFLLWLGVAAGLMGLITLLVPDMPFLLQTVVFAAFALATCIIYWKFIRPSTELRDDQPLLNRKGARMIGRQVVAIENFVNGRGKVTVGDSQWLAEGADISAGAVVEVVEVHGTTLKVVLVTADATST